NLAFRGLGVTRGVDVQGRDRPALFVQGLEKGQVHGCVLRSFESGNVLRPPLCPSPFPWRGILITSGSTAAGCEVSPSSRTFDARGSWLSRAAERPRRVCPQRTACPRADTDGPEVACFHESHVEREG